MFIDVNLIVLHFIISLQAAFQISGAPLLSHFTCGLELLCVLCIAMTVPLQFVPLCHACANVV